MWIFYLRPNFGPVQIFLHQYLKLFFQKKVCCPSSKVKPPGPDRRFCTDDEYQDFQYDPINFSADCDIGNYFEVQNVYVYNTAQNCSLDTSCKRGSECGLKGKHSGHLDFITQTIIVSKSNHGKLT